MGRGTVVPERIGDTPVSWILREKITRVKKMILIKMAGRDGLESPQPSIIPVPRELIILF